MSGKSSRRPGSSRRAGGSAARRVARSTRGPEEAVRPGMEGGAYKPLSDADIQKIHHTALDVLEEIGVGDVIPEILHYALPKGCTFGDDERLRIPRALMEDLIDVSAKEYLLYAPDPALDYEIKGQRVYMCTSGESVSILDYETQQFRPSTIVDLYDAARLADQMEHIHSFGQTFIATEFSEQAYIHDMNIGYAELAGTRKSFSLGIAIVDHIDPLIALFDLYLGKEGGFLERPFCTFGGCPIVSPLRFGKENAEVLVKNAELGLVADVAVAPQAGATAPAALAGALVQTFAETLACLAVVNMVNPGAPINFGMWPFISDLRTGSFSGGSGEEALVMAASAQMSNYYGFTTSMASGMTDSKTMDAQAGYEKGITTAALSLAGANMVASYPGIVGSLMGQSFEGMVIDNDMMGNVLRLLRGIEVNDETLSYEVIKETITGTGHYLNHGQTLSLMQKEYLYPEIADRRSAGEWETSDRSNVYQQARERVSQLLSSHYPEYISPAADERIRAHFPIKLDPKDMRAGNGRW